MLPCGTIGELESDIVPLFATGFDRIIRMNMRAEELRQLLDRRPFVPVRLYFSDGTAYDIRHPEMAFLTRSTVEIGISEKEGVRIFDRVIYCTLLHIVRVEDLNGQTPRTEASGEKGP